MKITKILLLLVLSLVVAVATASYVASGKKGRSAAQSIAKETRLAQVKRSGVLRCGYVTWPPFLTRDPNTGKMGGPFYELVEEIGRQLKLKIVWAGEVVMGQMLTDLNMNRYDMICDPLSKTPGRARESDFTEPLFFWTVYMYVRKDDVRFDQDIEQANQPDINFAALDGEGSSIFAEEHFSAATKISLPQLSSGNDLFMMVATKKADAVLQDPYAYSTYAATNPDVLKIAANGKAVHTIAAGMAIPADEPAFKAVLDTTIHYLHDRGFIDKLLKKYDTPVKFTRVAKRYEE